MTSTPLRTAREAEHTPSPHPTPVFLSSTATSIYRWTSAPLPTLASAVASTSRQVFYQSYARITSRPNGSARKGKARAGRGDEESRFNLGLAVIVAVEGGNEGVGVLTRLWEEDEPDNEDEDEVTKDEVEDGEIEEKGRRKMAEVHWCFRKQDLPGIMKDLRVADNEVLLAASTKQPVYTQLPIEFLLRTIPIHSRKFFKAQLAVSKGKVVPGGFWCSRAFDKFSKGGKVWRIDLDDWRDNGRWYGIWDVPDPQDGWEDSASEAEGSEFAGEGQEEEQIDVDGEEEEADEEEGAQRKSTTKRKRGAAATTPRKAKKAKTTTIPLGKKANTKAKPKAKRLPHPKSSTSHLPSSVIPLADLPVDPYERALRLLHVGATPESLPCREEEFVDVLGRVEEGVEGGGGGCLYIAGVPGTGKTATVHAVVKELKRKAEDGELPPFSYVEINGLKIPSPQHAYVVLWEAISGAKNCSSKTALRGLEAHFGRKTGGGARGPRGHTFVVLMDELDQLLTSKQDVVYNFFNWPTVRESQLFVVAVANRMDLPQHLAAKIKSRLGLQTILFQPYDRTSLIEIVQSRLIAHPKTPSEEYKVLQNDAITLAATKMAGTNGDARRVLDACRRAVEVAMENPSVHPVTAKEMMAVLNLMSSSPVATFIKQSSLQQKIMMAAVLRCVRREGVAEIPWRSVRSDHDTLTRSLLDSNLLLSNSELLLVFTSLLATHGLTCAYDLHKSLDDRKVALGMEISEVGRVLMNEGDGWRRALAGT
ncbi:origin recognition complex subunit 1, partial [Tremellales sp. Uapishka_1]